MTQTEQEPATLRANASRWLEGFFQARGHDIPDCIRDQVFPFFEDYALWTRGLGEKPKGLIVFGPIGAGKTTLCEDLLEAIRGVRNHDRIVVLRARKMAEDYAEFGDYIQWLRRASHADVFLDDLGAEKITSRFGVPWSMADYIDDRYIAWRDQRHITLITTNIDNLEGLVERYGHRAESRIREMVTPVTYAHPDRRPVWV